MGWIVKLSFSANQIDHDARWRFDPKKLALDPMNNEAITLSQQSDGGMIPRLRAVQSEDRRPDTSRFDSGAFDLGETDAPEARERLEQATRNSAKPAEEQAVAKNQTADLLDALRRRRGEREAASFEDDPAQTDSSILTGVSPLHPSTGSIRIVEIPTQPSDEDHPSGRTTSSQPTVHSTGPQQTGPQPRSGRKGRPTMPSWDEIVFGARSDDDLA
jgi:hypothetical protein